MIILSFKPSCVFDGMSCCVCSDCKSFAVLIDSIEFGVNSNAFFSSFFSSNRLTCVRANKNPVFPPGLWSCLPLGAPTAPAPVLIPQLLLALALLLLLLLLPLPSLLNLLLLRH